MSTLNKIKTQLGLFFLKEKYILKKNDFSIFNIKTLQNIKEVFDNRQNDNFQPFGVRFGMIRFPQNQSISSIIDRINYKNNHPNPISLEWKSGQLYFKNAGKIDNEYFVLKRQGVLLMKGYINSFKKEPVLFWIDFKNVYPKNIKISWDANERLFKTG